MERPGQSEVSGAPPLVASIPPPRGLDRPSLLALPVEPTHPRVLIIDDDAPVRGLLQTLLVPEGYLVEQFGLAEPALERIRADAPDLVLLDLNLPDMSGHDVLDAIRSDPMTRLLPVVMMTGAKTTAERVRAQSAGVTDFLVKPFSSNELLPRVRVLVTLKTFMDEHEHAEHVLLTLARTIDARDPYIAGHSGRAAEYADAIAVRFGMDATTRNDLRLGALFHDLGKIVVPDAVLCKPGRLNAEERAIMETHPRAGRDILSPMKTMRRALPIVYHHHERLDGSGYPEGISDSAIPMLVRVVSVADIFDALTTTRAYRAALSVEVAFGILDDGVRKGWWDADVVDAMRAAAEASGPPLA